MTQKQMDTLSGENRKSWSVGIGTTDACNLSCGHCYSRKSKISSLSFDDIYKLCNSININSINFGTGENGLNSDFQRIVEYVAQKNIKISLTSNGYTVNKFSDSFLKLFNDIDISVDFPSMEKHNSFRGKGTYEMAISALEKCKNLGIEVSIASCLMNINVKYVEEMIKFSDSYKTNLRYNIYKPVNSDEFTLSYDDFWLGINTMMRCSSIVSCGEPIVNAVISNPRKTNGISCGKNSIRIKPDGSVIPCVYYPESNLNIKTIRSEEDFEKDISDLFYYELKIDTLPEYCKSCNRAQICHGGCYSRRHYANENLNEPDMYCPKLKNEWFALEPVWTDQKDLVHSDYLCTLILCGCR